jgi:hypothetical protein
VIAYQRSVVCGKEHIRCITPAYGKGLCYGGGARGISSEWGCCFGGGMMRVEGESGFFLRPVDEFFI